MEHYITIFDIYGEEVRGIQDLLDNVILEDPPIIYLPNIDLISEIKKQLIEKAEYHQLRNSDVLMAFQQIYNTDLDSCTVCGQIDNGKRCGGILDKEVNVFGAYYQCRKVKSHRFPV